MWLELGHETEIFHTTHLAPILHFYELLSNFLRKVRVMAEASFLERG